MAPATTSSLQPSDGCSWQHRQQVPSEISPFITDGNGRDRWMLGTESKIQDAAKPLVQVMAGGLGDLVCCTQSHQRGPFLHRKRQRLCCMGRALPRAVSCHANAIYRSDIKWSTLLVTKVQTMGSFSWWLRAVQCLPSRFLPHD